MDCFIISTNKVKKWSKVHIMATTIYIDDKPLVQYAIIFFLLPNESIIITFKLTTVFMVIRPLMMETNEFKF